MNAIFFHRNIGIFFREGESWHEQRRFALRYLRDFGFGRRFDSFENEIEIQIKQFIDIVENGPKYEHEKVRIGICSPQTCEEESDAERERENNVLFIFDVEIR